MKKTVIILCALFGYLSFAQSQQLDLIFPDDTMNQNMLNEIDLDELLNEFESGTLLNSLDFKALFEQFQQEFNLSDELSGLLSDWNIDSLFEQIDTMNWNGYSQIIGDKWLQEMNLLSLDSLKKELEGIFNEDFFEKFFEQEEEKVEEKIKI